MPSAVPARPKAHRLLIASVVALLVIVALGALTATGYASATRWVEHALLVQKAVDEWEAVVLEAQSQARACVAIPDGCSGLDDSFERRVSTRASILLELVSDNAAQSEAVRAAEGQAREVLDFLEQQARLTGTGGHEQAAAAIASGEGNRLVAKFRSSVRGIYSQEESLLLDRRQAARVRAWGTLLAAAVLAAFAGWLLFITWQTDTRHEAVVNQLAREARDRLRFLSELSTALSAARSRAEVAALLNEHVMRVARGDTCTVYSLSEPETLTLLAHRGLHDDIVEKVRIISSTEGNPLAFDSVRERRSLWIESEAEYAALYPQLAKMVVPARRAKAFWSVPLIAEDRVLGLLGVGFYEARSFSADERAFIETLCHQCAEALLRATRTDAERRAQQWFSTTLRSIGDAVIATDARGKITFVNPEAERLTGFSEEEALGRSLEDVFTIISELTREKVESPVAKVLREGQVMALANHTLLLSRTGSEIPIDDSGAPIRDEAGEILGVVLVFRDVSEEKRRESRNAFLAKAGAALASSLDYEQTLATVAQFAVPHLADWCSVDLLDERTGRIRQVAVAHVDPQKVRFAQSIGARYPQPPSPTGVPQVIRSGKSELYPEIPSGLLEAQAHDAEHLALLGELSLHSAVVVPLSSRGRTFGALTFVYAESGRRYTEDDRAFAEDVARRAALAIENSDALRAAETARARERWLRQEAERANRLKDEILATVSHELRTPLNAILGWTVTLRRRETSAEAERALSIIERNARAQAKLIDDVLDVSRIVSGKLTLHLSAIQLRPTIEAAVETVTPAADIKRVRLEVEIEDDISLTADADRIQQVVWNLLSNSVKFTPSGGSVRVRLHRDGAFVCISISDTGEGIRPEMLRTIFEPFEQADNSSSRRHGGLGLGLSIVKQLTVAHGGTVSVASPGLGQGSTFTVRLPITTTVPVASGTAPPAAALAVDPLTGVEPVARLDGLRVLVVEDEPDSRLLTRDILARHGANVETAESVPDALAKFSPHKHDIIVSDIGMPGEDGHSFIRKVRASGGRTPAVALTAYVSPQDAQRAFAAGFQKHVPKPVEPAELVSVVASLGRSGSA